MNQVAWLGLIVLMATNCVGQRHGGSSGAARGGGAHAGVARGAYRSGGFRSRMAGGFNQRFGGFYPSALPLFDDVYEPGYVDDPEYAFPPGAGFGEPAPPLVIRRAPPPVVESAIHNYTASAPAAPAAGSEQPNFVIALNDTSRVAATAVWVQDGAVHYIDTDGRSRQLPLTSIDRELTRKLNQERNLNLRLPPPE